MAHEYIVFLGFINFVVKNNSFRLFLSKKKINKFVCKLLFLCDQKVERKKQRKRKKERERESLFSIIKL